MSSNKQAVPSAPPNGYSGIQNPPPPPYPGTQTTSVPHIRQQVDGVCKEWIPFNLAGSAQLGYIDIQPKCLDPGNFDLKKPPQFEPFSNLIHVANTWLRNNPHVAVVKCETTERRLQKFRPSEDLIIQVPAGAVSQPPANPAVNKHTPGPSHGYKPQSLTYDIDNMLKHEASTGTSFFIKGLRVWLRDKPHDSTPQQIGLIDTVPDEETVDIPRNTNLSDSFFVQGEKVMSYVSKAMDYKHHITFKGLRETVDKLNNSLEKHPIPGEIINLELVTLRRQFEESVSRDIDPNQTAFMVDLDKVTRYTKIIRLYYISGPSSGDKLGLYDMVPEVTKLPGPNTSMGRPQFQKESDLYFKLAQWLGQNQGVVIKSVLLTPVRFYYQSKFDKVYIAADSMDEVKETNQELTLLNTRLIFYTRPSSGYAPPITCFTSRVFMPLRLGLKSYENMGQTVERMNAWLRATGLSVFHIETMEMLFTENDRQGVNTEKTDYTIRPTFGMHFLVAYKLYFTRLFQEPDPRTQPPTIDWMTQGESTSCQIL